LPTAILKTIIYNRKNETTQKVTFFAHRVVGIKKFCTFVASLRAERALAVAEFSAGLMVE